MAFIFKSFLDWLRSLFFKEEMELTLVGLQNSGKTTLVNVLAVRAPLPAGAGRGAPAPCADALWAIRRGRLPVGARGAGARGRGL